MPTNHLETGHRRDNFAAAALRHYAEGLRRTTRRRSYQGTATVAYMFLLEAGMPQVWNWQL